MRTVLILIFASSLTFLSPFSSVTVNGTPFESTPLLTMSSALFAVTMWFILTSILPSASYTDSARYLPVILSWNSSIISFPSLKASMTIPGISFLPMLQSGSLMIRSCDTSTSRLVRYPESAVRRAVSESPLRAP